MPKKTKSQWDFGELFPVEETKPGKKEPSNEKSGFSEAKSIADATLNVSEAKHGTTSNTEHPTSNIESSGETATARRVLTVGELTGQVKRLLESQVGEVWVTGEVTNFRAQSSGHIYFTLKDAESQVSCVLFRNEARSTRGLVKDGQKLILHGELTVYEPRGQYQLRVTAVELEGLGALQLAFERLKQKLNAEGLFAQERKREIPRYAQRIGIVTSPTGAAIRDVLHVIQRRNPGLEIVLAPCRVQGQGAGEEIAEAIRLLNECGVRSAEFGIEGKEGEGKNVESRIQNTEFEGTTSPRPSPPFHGGEGGGNSGKAKTSNQPSLGSFGSASIPHRTPNIELDLILVTRGGGSLEDLWAFNEEVVARAIFESKVPVISAVGHEIDFTISDFVADLRAATPSAAAELITEGVFSSWQFLAGAGERMKQLFQRRIEDKEYEVEQLLERLARVHPRRRFDEWLQRLDDLQGGLSRCVRQGTRDRRTAWRNLADRLLRVRPTEVLERRRDALKLAEKRLQEQPLRRIKDLRHRLNASESRLRLLGPEQVLARGYSITTRAEDGKVVRSASEVEAGQEIRTRLKVGAVKSVVKHRTSNAEHPTSSENT